MLTLSRALLRTDGGGEALPVVWNKLSSAGVKFRRGQLAMLASAPNSGKSLLALIMAMEMKVPTLYVSADTDRHDTLVRAAARLTGQSMDSVAQGMEMAPEYYLEPIRNLDHLQFTFDPSPTLEDLDLELRAYIEVYGEPPHLVVIDNLINVQMDDVDEFRGLRLVMSDLHALAHLSDACVLVLHHVTGEFDGTDTPPPRRALHGKVSHLPELILTMCKKDNYVGVACVKNRNGPADPKAENAIWLTADFARVQVTEGY